MDDEWDYLASDYALLLLRAELEKYLIVVCKIIWSHSVLMYQQFERNHSRVESANDLINENCDFILYIIAEDLE